MKKCLVLLLTILACLPMVQAAELNATQKAMRTKMVTFLKEEGYVPEINDAGNIRFKVQGVIYVIKIYSNDTSPLFYSMTATYNYDNNVTRNKMDNIIAEINLYKAIKMTYSDDDYAIGSEVYLVDIDQFRYTFYKTLRAIQQAIEEIPTLAQSISSGSSTSSFNSGIALSYNNLFPLYGYHLGTPCYTFTNNGCDVRGVGTSSHVTDIGENQFWDFNGDNVMEAVSIEEVPSQWASNWGIDLSWSYNQWRAFFQQYNYSLRGSEPEVKTNNGRRYLYGSLNATSPDGKIEFYIDFDNGNRNGEGYTKDSRNSCDYFNIKLIN